MTCREKPGYGAFVGNALRLSTLPSGGKFPLSALTPHYPEMIKGARGFHLLFALILLAGCTAGRPAQALILWPAWITIATEEKGRVDFQLGAACTAAVRAGRLAELQELWAAGGPDFQPEDEYARNMLYAAAEAAPAELVAWLLSPEGGDLAAVKFQVIAGRSPLELAAEAGRE